MTSLLHLQTLLLRHHVPFYNQHSVLLTSSPLLSPTPLFLLHFPLLPPPLPRNPRDRLGPPRAWGGSGGPRRGRARPGPPLGRAWAELGPGRG